MLTLLRLPLIVQCCGSPQNAENDFLSLTKFMRLGPLESDSYCDSDDKIQPVQLLVKQRSGSQSVDKLAEGPAELCTCEPSPLPAQQQKRIQPKQQSQAAMQIAQDKQVADIADMVGLRIR